MIVDQDQFGRHGRIIKKPAQDWCLLGLWTLRCVSRILLLLLLLLLLLGLGLGLGLPRLRIIGLGLDLGKPENVVRNSIKCKASSQEHTKHKRQGRTLR